MTKSVNDMINNYGTNSIDIIYDDVKKIRQRIEPYIGYRGYMGFRHLIKEIIQNSIDEYSCGVASFVKIEYDEKTHVVKISDDGRGIPPEVIVPIFTVLQSSGKFNKGGDNAYKMAAGENGVGTTATNALSDYVNVTVFRNGTQTNVLFEDGVATNTKNKKCDKDKHGTIVEFKPSQKYLGKDVYDLDYNEILELSDYLSYLAKGCKLINEIKTKEGKSIKKTFKSDLGIVDKIKNTKGKLIEPIYIKFVEEDKIIEVALLYTNDSDENITSYANYCTTVDHGTHVVGFKQGLSNAVTRLIKENMSESEKKKYNVIADDAKSGLVAIVNANHVCASFVGQVKEKINNPDLIPFARNATFVGLNKWFKENDDATKKLIKHVKSVMKARINSEALRKHKISQPRSSFDLPEKFKPATGKTNLEIIVVEGDSAGGSANNARERLHQALYYLKGVPLNPYGLSLLSILANEEYRGFLTATGMKGSSFNINKFPYERIIILTDADTDGKRITSLFSVFIMMVMPEVIERGMLYKSVPPLYKIKHGKTTDYLVDNSEYHSYISKLIGNKAKVYDLNNNKLNIEYFLANNKYYLGELKSLSDRFSIHPYLLEKIVECDFNIKDIKKFIKSETKFLKMEDKKDCKIISGIYDKEYQHIKINDDFINKLTPLVKYKDSNNNISFYFDDGEKQIMTLGNVLSALKKYEPSSNRTRYKGVGEMDPEELWETTLDPESRTLIRLTTDDIQKDIERFGLLHGKNIKMRSERKEMMAKFKLAIDEIDN